MVFMISRANLMAQLKQLEAHLKKENPTLLKIVRDFRRLDRISHRLGILSESTSYTTQVPWWPMISIMGTFSAGKSTFLNHYIDYPLQKTGNQAVDEKFTVICYSNEDTVNVLPGMALDADPRFPFYKISNAIEKVASGEGRRIDAYLQLKTCPSELLRGKILIDSPGFDADAQRTSTLRITNHIIDLSDLVLVFFDARHPEPGAMHDTLEHLITETINRHDSNKFLYILNQIDTTAREDNAEEVVASWQRALAQKGLTAGRFYRIYNEEEAVAIESPATRIRYQNKRDVDLKEIKTRMQKVEIERAYRIINILEHTSENIRKYEVPRLKKLLQRWKRRVLWTEGITFGGLIGLLVYATLPTSQWQGIKFTLPAWFGALLDDKILLALSVGGVLVIGLYLHFSIRDLCAKRLAVKLTREIPDLDGRQSLLRAFRQNTSNWRSLFNREPAGWGRRANRTIDQVQVNAGNYIRELNDRYADPSGKTPPEKHSQTPAKNETSHTYSP